MTDTYLGDSLGKKLARAWFWFRAARALGDSFYQTKHLVLASREGGDVRVLRALGVATKNILAVEMNPVAAEAFACQYPDVPLLIGDVANLVNRRDVRGKVGVAHLDFCSWSTPTVLAAATRVARFAIVSDGILCIGVMKGREQGHARKGLIGLGLDLERDDFRDRLRASTVGSKTGAASERRVTSTLRSAFMARELAQLLAQPGPLVFARPLESIGYDSGRTPMVYCPFRVRRFLSRAQGERWIGAALYEPESDIVSAYQMEIGEGSPRDAVAMAAGLLRLLPGVDAGELLTLPRGKLAAWRAHRTRGSYGVTA
ncbi:MAG TPA: hypothetical protein VGK73_36465 [Polyangiaceae bacterium]